LQARCGDEPESDLRAQPKLDPFVAGSGSTADYPKESMTWPSHPASFGHHKTPEDPECHA
jgi:hypothetical protein